ncbi:MAG: triose-phosphate isomerase [Fimbriimonadaceae bacterium]|nr:triose-phosphate isomerase [Fimbriimonadaceae bacterium]
MRRKLVAGNWKMNLTHAESLALVESFIQAVELDESVDVVICPPYLSIAPVIGVTGNARISVGAQDVFWAEAGAFTGRVSAAMLADAGVTHCIVGHSETRGRFGKLEIPESTVGYFAETDETVRLKIAALLSRGIRPILCVGETLSEREASETDAVIRQQLVDALAGFAAEELGELVVAYEPVWAIGTGKTCDAPEANRVCAHVRAVLADQFGRELAEAVRVLYGGSVKAANARELFATSDIDGGLVGGASLSATEFAAIVHAAVRR